MITVAAGANGETGSADVGAALGAAGDLLIISAEIPVAAIGAALAAARQAGTPCLLNLAPAPPGAAGLLSDGVDWLVVNESEAAAILRRPVAGLDGARTAALELRRLGARNVVVTAGAAGAALAGGGPAAPGGERRGAGQRRRAAARPGPRTARWSAG